MPLLLLALTLAACTPGTPRPDDLAARAAAAGLTEAQARALVALGVPVVVPVLPEGWAPTAFAAEAEEYEGFVFPFYSLVYGRADGTCFSLEAASEGLGDVFVEAPPHTREVAAPGVATYGPVLLGWADEGEVADVWEGPYTRTEWFGADGLAVRFNSDAADGCRRVTPDEAAALLAGLRYLDPDDDALALGALAFVDLADPFIGDLANGPTPEAAAAQAFGQAGGEGGAATSTEMLRQRPGHAVVLVTNTNLLDDSVRDERVRAVLRPGDEGWLVTEAGRQVRCREGRGHEGWGSALCL